MAAAISGTSVQSSSYTYDLLGNPVSRTDDTQGRSESSTYDPLNRLLTAVVAGSIAPAKAYSYNSIGNMMSKSDVGTYTYAPPGSPRPLTDATIRNSTMIIDARLIRNPAILAGYSKFQTETFESPVGDLTVHFYYNVGSGNVYYDTDYKVVFNSRSILDRK